MARRPAPAWRRAQEARPQAVLALVVPARRGPVSVAPAVLVAVPDPVAAPAVPAAEPVRAPAGLEPAALGREPAVPILVGMPAAAAVGAVARLRVAPLGAARRRWPTCR